MPELPEVETLRQVVEPMILGQELVDLEVIQNGKKQYKKLDVDLHRGRMVTCVLRLGKNLIIQTQDSYLIVHLMMSGSMATKPEKHTRAIFSFGPGKLYFIDPRNFGRLESIPDAEAFRQWASGYGPDVLNISFEVFRDRIRQASDREIKGVLMHQQTLCGIGNYMAAESLFRARINPKQMAHSIPEDRLADLHRELEWVTHTSLACKGSYVVAYAGKEGASTKGPFSQYVQMYGRKTQPCLGCGGKTTSEQVCGRTSTFCPNCQPLRTEWETK